MLRIFFFIWKPFYFLFPVKRAKKNRNRSAYAVSVTVLLLTGTTLIKSLSIALAAISVLFGTLSQKYLFPKSTTLKLPQFNDLLPFHNTISPFPQSASMAVDFYTAAAVRLCLSCIPSSGPRNAPWPSRLDKFPNAF